MNRSAVPSWVYGASATPPRYTPSVSPTVLRDGPYRFFFFSNERGEPPHIHVQRDRCLAKYWLEPVALAASTGFGPRELRIIASLVATHADTFREAWHVHFHG